MSACKNDENKYDPSFMVIQGIYFVCRRHKFFFLFHDILLDF